MTAFDPARTRAGYGAIDIVVNCYTPEIVAAGHAPTDERFREKVGIAGSERRGTTLEDYIAKMDRAGIERSLLVAARCGDLRVKGSTEVPYEAIVDACRKYPDRFSGLAGIDPTRGIAGLKELDRAVHEYGFVGAHLYPHWFGQAPDAAIYYPYYARCAELGIPIMMQVGQCLVYQTRSASAVRGTADRARPGGDRLPRADPDRHPSRLSVGGRDDLVLLEASERLHGRGCLRARSTGPRRPSITRTPMGRTNSCSVPIGG